MSIILGISCYYHDSSAALIENGKILYAIQEERLSRIKHDPSFPKLSIKKILLDCNITPNQIEAVCFYDKPLLTFERLIETYLATAPRGLKSFIKSMPHWIKDKIFQKKKILKELLDLGFNKKVKIKFAEHHLSHAASAFYPSPFNKALIVTIDGVGEWATTSVAIGRNNEIKIIKEINFPHSLGLLYSAFTSYAGFKVNSGEYKLMGLAPYGEPIFSSIIKDKIIKLNSDGSFFLNQKYFSYSTDLKMFNKHFVNLFKEKQRLTDEKIEKFHMDIAASIQQVIEEALIKMLISLKKEFNYENLCLAGGVALNCVANGKILKKKIFKNIWIQPAAGDAGGSIGAALLYWFEKKNDLKITKKNSVNDFMQGSYLGNELNNNEIENTFERLEANFQKLEYENLIKFVSEELSKNKYIGWVQGRMEFGPRALGNRSILASPISESTQKDLNLKIKFRESFRPFAPAILYENLQDWFEIEKNTRSDYMLFVSSILNKHRLLKNKSINVIGSLNSKRSSVPAITHIDFTSRIQTVHRETNKKFYDLISSFKDITGIPILVNTSFNVRGEPIVSSAEDAYRCFMGTNLDILVINNYVLIRSEQSKNNLKKYSSHVNKFLLD